MNTCANHRAAANVHISQNATEKKTGIGIVHRLEDLVLVGSKAGSHQLT